MRGELTSLTWASDRAGRAGWAGYVVGLLVVAASFGLLLAVPSLGTAAGTPQLILLLSVLIVAWYGGFGPGLFATALIVVVTLPHGWTPWSLVRLAVF
ncbi:MAG TPA: hypothetical protein VFF52_29945, partial [Isosphaeraceae bacterium]|nr:hypothetical protein [Isosphaeraceae bacterium]